MLNKTKSATGIHTLFIQSYNGLPVFNVQRKVNQSRNKVVFKESIIKLNPIDFDFSTQFTLLKEDNGYLFEDGNYIEVKKRKILTESQYSYTFYTFENKIIHCDEHHLFYKDTIIKGNVFLPDPITSSNTEYGDLLSDNNDLNSPNFDNELFEKDIKIRWENDSFRLENKHLKISNHSSPDIPVTIKNNDDFKFNRSENGFEEVNAIYHLTKFAEYIKDSLGYQQIVNYQIAVDVYALSNTDQSEFINATNPPRLNFGQGAVDDAEDADILIHEYAHAISFSAAPNTIAGTERKAIEEGIGDYFAAVYSKKLNVNNYKTIFNWDGHNEFWAGRSIDNSRHYPEEIQGQKYDDGELYASVLMQIRNKIPDTVADRVIIESMFSWFSNMTFIDAGQLLLDADTALYKGNHRAEILNILCERGMATNNCPNSIEKYNTNLRFTISNKTLRILDQPTIPNIVIIYNSKGELIITKIINPPSEIPLKHLSEGVYYLQINSDKKTLTQKFVLTE